MRQLLTLQDRFPTSTHFHLSSQGFLQGGMTASEANSLVVPSVVIGKNGNGIGNDNALLAWNKKKDCKCVSFAW